MIVFDEDRYKRVPCDALIANHSIKRPANQSYIMWWKGRRNAKLALKKRLREGVKAEMLLDIRTMSVVTERAQQYAMARGHV